MKKFTLFLLALAGLTALAGTGRAVVSHHDSLWTSSTSYFETWYNISNITGAAVTVTITFYDQSGNIMQDGDDSTTTGTFQANNVTSYDDNPTGASVSFDLGANSTGQIFVRPSSYKFGYAVIEWDQSSDAVHALIAHGMVERYYGASTIDARAQRAILINQGRPF